MTTPVLALNFTGAVLDPRITITRSLNTATRINSSGFIEGVNADLPRFDYDPVTLACKGLLIEESRSNAAVYSNDVTGTGWTIGGLTTSTPTTSPDGTANSVLLLETNTTGFHRAFQAVTTTPTAWSVSAYFKPSGRDWVWLRMSDNTGIKYAWFNVTTGAVGTVESGLTAAIYPSKNGFYRCTITAATAANGAAAIIFGTGSADNVNSFTGDTSKGVYFYGLQVELGAFPTSYIPTTTTALTRNADVATITGTNFSGFWNAGVGGTTVTALPSTVSGTRPLVQFDDGTANEIIALRGNTTNPELYIVDGGTPQAQIDAGTIAANTSYTLTGWWQTNFCAARLSNGARVEDLTATIPTVTQMRIGSDGTNYLNGTIATIYYYNVLTGQIYTRRKNKVILSVI